jgi:hypothetical protein
MTKEWIAHLAQNIQQKNHQAAENFGREQHRQDIILSRGQPFFTALAMHLEENFNEIRRELQGDVTAAETSVQNAGPSELKLSRSRFPWFDARVTLANGVIVLDYAKDRGVSGDPALDRKSCHFEFHVADDDSFSTREAFGDTPAHFHQPEELAQRITEILLAV